MKRILLVEDEQSLRKVIQLNLEMENYEVVCALDGKEAIAKIDSEHFDLIILDLMLPQISGLDVLHFLRVKNDQLPVIITSAKDTSSDRINGLKAGADDYLTKPFELEELFLRVEKLIQRKTSGTVSSTIDQFQLGQWSIDFNTYTAQSPNEKLELSQKELHILKYLIQQKNKAVSRQEILKAVWGYDVFPSTRTIDNFIASLRKKFEKNPKSPQFIKSVHGVGYKFSDA